jgi:predicted regulator of Ras-like GTPase activity (Roadblock/LC7/MglB family)
VKGIAAIIVFVLGAAAFLCIGVLLAPTVLGVGLTLGSEAALVVAGGGALLLFVLGVFAGYLYGVPTQRRQANKSMLERFGKALEFERRQRTRLESELIKSRQALVSLEDELARLGSASRMPEPIAPANAENDEVSAAYEKLKTEYEQLRDNLTRRKERIADLQTELSIAQAEAERARQEALRARASTGAPPFIGDMLEGTSLRDILERIVSLEGVHVALVADDYGLVIDSAGQSLPAESVAAISSLIAHLGPRVRDVLPMGKVSSVTLMDDQGLVLETRYFELLGTQCAVAVARDQSSPFTGLTQEASEAIIARMQ